MPNWSAIQTFMSQNDISMQMMKMGQPGPVPQQEAADCYRCKIKRPGRQIDVYVAVPPEEGEITPSDVLLMLILDASGCEMFKDYYARHVEFDELLSESHHSSDGFDEFWQEYESRCRQSRRLKTFLGKNLYEELINRFGFDN